MPTITVNREFRSYRVNVTPSTLLGDVLRDSCLHFKLNNNNNNNNNNTQSYALEGKNGKKVDLSLPFRFSNLAQGANLELIGPIGVVNSDDINGNNRTLENTKYVTIRASINLMNTENITLTEKFVNDCSLEKVLKSFENMSKRNFKIDDCVVQIMMKIVDHDKYFKTLNDLGLVEGNHAIRIRIKPENHSHSRKNEKETQVSAINEVDTFAKVERDEKTHKLDAYKIEQNINRNYENENRMNKQVVDDAFSIEVLKTGSSNIVDDDIDDDSDLLYEMNIAQAKLYRKILQKQSADQPLLTKALRDKFDKEEKEKKLESKRQLNSGESTIRIKFPDNNMTQIKIDNRQTLKEVSKILVNRILRKEIIPTNYIEGGNLFFELYIPHPYNKIVAPGIELNKAINECEFGNRILLHFKIIKEFESGININNGYILDELLKMPPTNEKKYSDGETNINNNNNNNNHNNNNMKDEIDQQSTKLEQQNLKKKAKLKQIPAWLKLSKKV